VRLLTRTFVTFSLFALGNATLACDVRSKLEPATSAGVILAETGQFLLLYSLQLWHQLQRCRQTRARVQVFLTHFTSVLRKQFAANDTFLREANGYRRALALRNARQVTRVAPGQIGVTEFPR